MPLPSKRSRRRALAICFVLALGLLMFFSSEGVKQLLPATSTGDDPLFQVNTTNQVAALTINVAWGEEYLPDMLNALKEAGVNATFFMVGDWVEQFPDLTQALAADGHELGNHSWSHPYPTQIPAEALSEEIKKTEKLLVDLTGQECKLFAPPYGEWDKEVVLTAAELGYRTIMWTIDTIDWQKPGVDVIASRVLDNLAPGSIILMHPTDQTAQALPQILSGAKEKGYKLMTVGQLIANAES
jgi:probable sporulation protein (polysaccharide deacetylase family)